MFAVFAARGRSDCLTEGKSGTPEVPAAVQPSLWLRPACITELEATTSRWRGWTQHPKQWAKGRQQTTGEAKGKHPEDTGGRREQQEQTTRETTQPDQNERPQTPGQSAVRCTEQKAKQMKEKRKTTRTHDLIHPANLRSDAKGRKNQTTKGKTRPLKRTKTNDRKVAYLRWPSSQHITSGYQLRVTEGVTVRAELQALVSRYLSRCGSCASVIGNKIRGQGRQVRGQKVRKSNASCGRKLISLYWHSQGDTGSIPRCKNTTQDSQPDHLGGEGGNATQGRRAFGAKGHGGKQQRGTPTSLEQSRQPVGPTSNCRMEEGTRGNNWTREPQQAPPGAQVHNGKQGTHQGALYS